MNETTTIEQVEDARKHYHALLVSIVQQNVSGKFSEFVNSVASKFVQYGSLTPKQLDAFEKSYYRIKQQTAQPAATPPPGRWVPQTTGVEEDVPF